MKGCKTNMYMDLPAGTNLLMQLMKYIQHPSISCPSVEELMTALHVSVSLTYLEVHVVQVDGVCISTQVDNIPHRDSVGGGIGRHLGPATKHSGSSSSSGNTCKMQCIVLAWHLFWHVWKNCSGMLLQLCLGSRSSEHR
jgi:hypothetical protein